MTIQTPPQSPEDPPRRLSAGNVSPPPPPQSPDNDDDSDSTATADSELEEAARNTRRNSGSLPTLSTVGASATKAPYNPFARTLATQEAAYGLQPTDDKQQDSEVQDENVKQRANDRKAPLDVDEFKNILLTGNTTRLQDNSSGTDTSSVSRQSLFDQTLETHAETPRTSIDQIELLESPSDSDEGSSLVSGNDRMDDLAPPTPPKHKHGKILAPKGPQSVSFSDFEASIKPSLSRSATSPTASGSGDNSGPAALQGITRNANKPLPNPPVRSPTATDSLSSVLLLGDQSSQAAQTATVAPKGAVPQKKAAPPPPAARRTGAERNRSDSNPTRDNETKQFDDTEPSRTSIDVGGVSTAPPPPPARKTRPLSQSATPRTETPPEAPSPAPANTKVDAKGVRPRPPPRGSSKTGGSLASALNRSPSNGSHSSISWSETPSSSTNAPPAPPPRRSGVNSGRTSIDGRPLSLSERRRSSEYSVKAERSTSLSNLENVTETGETQRDGPVYSPSAAPRDILADLSAFQAEIDALRSRADNG